MADPFDDLFDPANDTIGADFEAQCAGLKPVTVRQINPHTGATLATVSNVSALKRVRRVAVQGVGGDGGAGFEAERFLMRITSVGFTPSGRDEIEEASGTVWQVGEQPGDVDVIGFGQIAAVNVTKKRTDASQS